MDLVDRRTESRQLNRCVQRDGEALGVLYGRRRVGKTFLLNHLWGDHRKFYFLAARTTPEQNRRELIEELNEVSDLEYRPEDYPTWRSVFRLLVEEARKDSLIVVLDEVQFLMEPGKSREFASELNAVWEQEAPGIELTVFLCGSEISVLKHLNDGDAPLHGRFDYFDRLTPFDYYDASRMIGDRPPEEAITTYAIYGGMPAYLKEVPEELSLKEHVCRNILAKNGSVGNQLDSLFEMEQGLREPGKYRAVLTAVAQGNTTVNDIAQVSGVTGERNEPTRRKLEKLQNLFLVRRERNFETSRGEYRYYVSDPAVKFWYRFVHRNRGRLDRGRVEEVWDHRISESLRTYVGTIFERVVEDAFFRWAPDWGFSRPNRWGRWVGKDRNRNDVEVDVVSELDDGRMLTGEIKWSSRPVGDRLHSRHVGKLEALRESGKEWAHSVLDGETSAGHFYVSSAGFREEFRERARREDRITLIALDDLFPEE